MYSPREISCHSQEFYYQIDDVETNKACDCPKSFVVRPHDEQHIRPPSEEVRIRAFVVRCFQEFYHHNMKFKYTDLYRSKLIHNRCF